MGAVVHRRRSRIPLHLAPRVLRATAIGLGRLGLQRGRGCRSRLLPLLPGSCGGLTLTAGMTLHGARVLPNVSCRPLPLLQAPDFALHIWRVRSLDAVVLAGIRDPGRGGCGRHRGHSMPLRLLLLLLLLLRLGLRLRLKLPLCHRGLLLHRRRGRRGVCRGILRGRGRLLAGRSDGRRHRQWNDGGWVALLCRWLLRLSRSLSSVVSLHLGGLIRSRGRCHCQGNIDRGGPRIAVAAWRGVVVCVRRRSVSVVGDVSFPLALVLVGGPHRRVLDGSGRIPGRRRRRWRCLCNR
mmetsp:Transcript_15316/g.46272  ORF Transcript_15316/g.46272 Transcript_15316/m.46272 type:complete len:294 (-) Transcript_15316:1329-2210(-)